MIPISERPIRDLLPKSLTSTPCVNVRPDAKVWVVTGMLVQYLESFSDSVVVRSGDKPIGVIGGKEIITGVHNNPTWEFFDMKTVGDIVNKQLPFITPEITLQELLSIWKDRGRAFAVINTDSDNFSAISAKKLLEIGMKCSSEFYISEIPKKKIVTFTKDNTIKEIINLMLKNNSRKILFEGSNQFINDRILIEMIEKLNYLRNKENFLNISAEVIALEDAKIISENLKLSDISKIMYEMPHPFVIYNDQPITPWDICITLLREELTEYEEF